MTELQQEEFKRLRESVEARHNFEDLPKLLAHMELEELENLRVATGDYILISQGVLEGLKKVQDLFNTEGERVDARIREIAKGN